MHLCARLWPGAGETPTELRPCLCLQGAPGGMGKAETQTDDFSEPDWCSGRCLINAQITPASPLCGWRWKRGPG